MRVALVSHNILPGDGQGRVNYELARYLSHRGVDVHLVADRVAPDLTDDGCTWHPVHPGFDSIDLLKVARFRRQADAALDQMSDEIDLVLACGVVLTRPHTINAVHFVHGPWLESRFHNSRVQTGPQRWYQYAYSALNARWEKQILSKARHVVAVSELVRDELIEIGLPRDKITVVVNGVDLDEFAPGPVERRALELPERPVLGLFVGDIKSPIKNLGTALRAMADVPDVHLAVAGEKSGSPYPRRAAELGIDDRVHFLDFRRDIAELMRAADFFILPSRRDSCPLALLEALASGLPVVVSSRVGNADLVENGAGFIVDDPEDAETLTSRLSILANNPQLRTAMSKTARSVAEQYSWDRMSRRYLKLFERVLDVDPQPPHGQPEKSLESAGL